LIDNWLRHVEDVARKHEAILAAIPGVAARRDRLCELNVIEQVANVCGTTIVRGAWQRGQELSVHGWIYRVSDGLLRDLGLCVESEADLAGGYAAAVGRHSGA
jgi:carbonic anhydrase